MHTSWDDIQLFLAVAESGSVTAAARTLGVTQPTASRRLLHLETRLGAPLFVRGKDGAALTSFGERLLEPARRMAEYAGETERVVDGTEVEPRGLVRVTAPPWVAFDFLGPLAAMVRQQLPEVALELNSTVQYLDLVRREADLALRLHRPSQRELITIAELGFHMRAYASRDYVARLAKGTTPNEVDWIGWAPPFEHLFPNPELARLIPGFRPVCASNDFLVQMRAAMVGVGAIYLGDVRPRSSLDLGLVSLPVKVPSVAGTMRLIAARSALLIPRVRAVADILASEFAVLAGA